MGKKKNILIITHHNLYPIESGGAVTLVAYIDELQKHHQVSIVLFHPYVPKPGPLAELAKRWPNVKIHHPGTSDGTVFIRLKNNFKQFLQLFGFFKPPVYSLEETSYINYEPLRYHDALLLQRVLQEQTFDYIEVNHSDQLAIAFFLPEHTPRFFVNHEPRFKRTEIQLDKKMINKDFGKAHFNYQLKFENELMEMYDGIICLNDNDTEYIKKYISRPVFSSTFPLLQEDLADLKDETTTSKELFFLGSGNHYPNFDAVKWYKEELGQKIFEKTGLKLQVYGEWDSGKTSVLKSPFIEFRGFVENLKDIAQQSIMLVPVRYGGGIRTKIQWAMGVGVPVISTLFGHEGIPAIHQESIWLAENADEYLAGVEALVNDLELKNKLRKNGNQLVKKHFGPEALIHKRMQIYEELSATKKLNA